VKPAFFVFITRDRSAQQTPIYRLSRESAEIKRTSLQDWPGGSSQPWCDVIGKVNAAKSLFTANLQ
jgi:hypothetical protein